MRNNPKLVLRKSIIFFIRGFGQYYFSLYNRVILFVLYRNILYGILQGQKLLQAKSFHKAKGVTHYLKKTCTLTHLISKIYQLQPENTQNHVNEVSFPSTQTVHLQPIYEWCCVNHCTLSSKKWLHENLYKAKKINKVELIKNHNKVIKLKTHLFSLTECLLSIRSFLSCLGNSSLITLAFHGRQTLERLLENESFHDD